MSGGRFNYMDRSLCTEIFDEWADYDLEGLKDLKDARKRVRRKNVFEDVEISELIFDVFCLIHSYDWYASGDTGEDDYRKDVEYFKRKWFGKTAKQRAEKVAKDAIEEFADGIKKIFGVMDENRAD